MRAPRYRFPDEVRTTTRAIASRMVQEGAVVHSPEELDAWIATRGDVKQSLEQGGYGTAFAADDLFPLLQVFIEKAVGPIPPAETPQRSSGRGWLLGLGLVLVVLVVLLATILLR